MPTPPVPSDVQLEGLRGSEAGDALFNDLRRAIESGQLADGHKIAPLRSLAKRYNISVTTARAALLQLAELKLVDARQGSGTYVTNRGAESAGAPAVSGSRNTPPAQGTGRPRSKMVVEVVSNTDAHVIDRLTSEIVAALQEKGRPTVLVGWRDSQGIEQLESVFSRWRANPPEAIVLGSSTLGLDEKIEEACGGRSRIVTTFRDHYKGRESDSVDPDRLECYRDATAPLVSQGHKRIGLVTAPRHISAQRPWTLRKRTMWNTEFILAAGKVVREAGKPHTIMVHYELAHRSPLDPWSEANLEKLAKWLGGPDRPSAIIGDDFRVAAAIRAADRIGLKLGRDLAAIGIGNTPWAEAFGFSSMSFREDVIARHVVNLVCKTQEAQADAEPVQHMMVMPKLVER